MTSHKRITPTGGSADDFAQDRPLDYNSKSQALYFFLFDTADKCVNSLTIKYALRRLTVNTRKKLNLAN